MWKEGTGCGCSFTVRIRLMCEKPGGFSRKFGPLQLQGLLVLIMCKDPDERWEWVCP
jgi:hypothetical protein